ncbi:ATP-binding protein [Rhizobium lentis]|uniref:ATPase n=1 Tax=Rhizobium lentis TaxID=1138194 RepID=A0ABS7I944_9HYPH|nr:winged helix-turn-helix domain-containing protein [Rhizobium lentis]MBX5088363.1 ATPase [Rhizobium lentis]
MNNIDHRGHGTYSFGPFTFATERQTLMKDNIPIRIGGRAADILALLLERAGEVVSKAELYAKVWPNVTVNESNLKVNMAAIRRALGDRSGAGAFIETIPGLGYSFVAPVEVDLTKAVYPSNADRHNLATTTIRVVGRDGAISDILQDLETSRLVTVVGPGGIGKTTVALTVAGRALGRFKDGVWMVDFASLRDPQLVPNAIALAVGQQGMSADMLDSLLRHLADRELMLVLDNCEHLADTVAKCCNLILEKAPQVKVLATSRELLGVEGERVRILAGLESPPATSGLTADIALKFPAVQLFVERAADRLETFVLADSDAQFVAEICRRLDGLALAIELAAMRVDVFGIKDILSQLDDQIRLLTGRRGGLERHRTLAATIEWSYGLLRPDEAAVLRALSVFPASFDIDGASAVTRIAPAQIEGMLNDLAAKSLLSVGSGELEMGYRLLETTRVYCAERLRNDGDDQLARRLHAQHVCKVFERAAMEWTQTPAKDWAVGYKRYLDDLRGALDWSENARKEDALLIRLTVAGDYMWNHLSFTNERCHRLAKAIERLGAAWLAGTVTEMKLQISYAWSVMFTRGMVPSVKEALQRALEIALVHGDAEYRLRTLRMIAGYQVFVGEHDAAIEKMKSFIEIAKASDPTALPVGLVTLALAEVAVGNLQTGRARVVELWRTRISASDSARFARFQLNEDSSTAIVLSWAEWLAGFPEKATSIADEAVTLSAGHDLSLGNSLAASACPIAYWTGDTDRLTSYLDMLDDYIERHGVLTWKPVSQVYRGALHSQRRNPDADTVQMLAEAIESLRAMNHFVRLPYYLGVFASVLLDQGRIERAHAVIKSALDQAEVQNERWCVPELMRLEAAINAAGGKLAQAEANLLRSIEFAEDIGTLSWKLRATNDLAGLYLSQARPQEAERALRAVRLMFKEGFQTADLVRSKALLHRATQLC